MCSPSGLFSVVWRRGGGEAEGIVDRIGEECLLCCVRGCKAYTAIREQWCVLVCVVLLSLVVDMVVMVVLVGVRLSRFILDGRRLVVVIVVCVCFL